VRRRFSGRFEPAACVVVARKEQLDPDLGDGDVPGVLEPDDRGEHRQDRSLVDAKLDRQGWAGHVLSWSRDVGHVALGAARERSEPRVSPGPGASLEPIGVGMSDLGEVDDRIPRRAWPNGGVDEFFGGERFDAGVEHGAGAVQREHSPVRVHRTGGERLVAGEEVLDRDAVGVELGVGQAVFR
jgi:hypothetical protein